ncbi:rhodanese-like domain-containing protein [Pelagibius litoralis]|uniref:Rhodanese-like domain-containing protein n=1 Tax=Pelagibius litoralis TaxID=374515 RepID=A0A967C355_9PROT|nr:rhodanese-like domain-containing protein [Pelagibius litoralis]NIA68873.1 rhodanese-like domain-containing protein [Pelagibius litoralis]
MSLAKGFKDLLAEANAVIDVISVHDAEQLLEAADVAFIDLREREELAQGTIPGAAHVPRGLLEFVADPESPMHNPAFDPAKRLVVFCASGGRSTLAAKTLHDMGFLKVTNMVGGFQAWAEAGAPVDPLRDV